MATTLNYNVKGLHDRVGRFITEVNKSNSGNTPEFASEDVERLKTYLAASHAYISWVTSEPKLDLPKTDRVYNLDTDPDTPSVDNESVNDVVFLLETLRNEMGKSDSARLKNGFNGFDTNRWTATIKKCESFVSEYVEKATPLDLPQSSPSGEVTN